MLQLSGRSHQPVQDGVEKVSGDDGVYLSREACSPLLLLRSMDEGFPRSILNIADQLCSRLLTGLSTAAEHECRPPARVFLDHSEQLEVQTEIESILIFSSQRGADDMILQGDWAIFRTELEHTSIQPVEMGRMRNGARAFSRQMRISFGCEADQRAKSSQLAIVALSAR